jgi:hypothetical protein
VRHIALRIAPLIAVVTAFSITSPTHAAADVYRTDVIRWRAAADGFRTWQTIGVSWHEDGTLRLDPQSAAFGRDPYAPGAYNGRNFYNGGSFLVGEALSPFIPARFPFAEAIPSWNVETPAGTWVETQLRARVNGHWTTWYNLGVWAADNSTVERHSVGGQEDDDARVAVDTLVLKAKKAGAGAFQFKLRLFSANSEQSAAVPVVRAAAVAISTAPQKPKTLTPGDPSRWGRTLAVPECSQMVYPDGGEVWCSPTSTAMALGYWANDGGACEPRLRAAVEGVYDWIYDGHGNWPFNTAYAATQGMEGYIARFTSMAQVEEWIAAGVPVIFSFSWKNDLTGAPSPSSNGHLAVIVGFDAEGNPVVNDPAATTNDAVQRTYLRSELERLWLEHSGGTVYLIYPPDHAVPLSFNERKGAKS